MAFTSADIDTIDRAIMALVQGARSAEVRFADGRTVKYTEATLPQLRELRSFVAQQVAGTIINQDPAQMSGGVSYADWSNR